MCSSRCRLCSTILSRLFLMLSLVASTALSHDDVRHSSVIENCHTVEGCSDSSMLIRLTAAKGGWSDREGMEDNEEADRGMEEGVLEAQQERSGSRQEDGDDDVSESEELEEQSQAEEATLESQHQGRDEEGTDLEAHEEEFDSQLEAATENATRKGPISIARGSIRGMRNAISTVRELKHDAVLGVEYGAATVAQDILKNEW
eukprot:gnl/TRDRNA2_/TRDRNA2_36715_c0_seq1.p1 gnl/TRDRNA2_/TRDRNA2_36715_c0~~gnl/TRDRNA2_/TRDRNA2_36715_c0_seq1.p1  ORF type:complete len:203 (+),score=33.70 gnl/TRDRNA2_/TRDRNA2_36715_c0_seq1:51-659(+)